MPESAQTILASLREEVRSFLRLEMPSYEPGLGTDGLFSPEFSQKLGAMGWLCMTLPQEYGGHGRSALERFVVTEELISAGAPIMASWAADRQIAQAIHMHGSEDQRLRFIPQIAAGECYFALGMSEPESGSDLASVRTSGTRVDGGWSLNGQKIWTSYAHVSDYVMVLCRTDPAAERHAGLSQLIVPVDSPGIDIRPILLLNGDHHFNEVFFDDVFVPDDLVLGAVGEGWAQVTSELGNERAGADRYLSTFSVLRAWLDEATPQSRDALDGSELAALGEFVARTYAIREMSWGLVSRTSAVGAASSTEAALVKDLGTTFEQDSVHLLRRLSSTELVRDAESQFERLLFAATLKMPMVTVRGGTTEVLRTVAARGLEVRS